MDPQIEILYEIEQIEAQVQSAPAPEAEGMVHRLDGLILELPVSLRDQYEWLRSWTRYPIARLRDSACTGCGARYDAGHAFLNVSRSQITYCEHCLRILLLRDLHLVA